MDEEFPEPVAMDVEIFKTILDEISDCNPNDHPGALRNKLADISILKANKDERSAIIEILACIGILAPKSYDRGEPSKHDWTYATYWRGEDGYDNELVEKYFGKYLK